MNSLGNLFRTLKRYTDCRSELVEAAYWYLAENHAGQWSWEYEALCRLGRVYSPGYLGNRPLDNHALDAITCA